MGATPGVSGDRLGVLPKPAASVPTHHDRRAMAVPVSTPSSHHSSGSGGSAVPLTLTSFMATKGPRVIGAHPRCVCVWACEAGPP